MIYDRVEALELLTLANSLKTPLAFFDLEHSGGPGVLAITAIGIVVLHPCGAIQYLSSKVKPQHPVIFNPFVVRLTGITEKSLQDAPTFESVYSSFIEPHLGAIWIGFNSGNSDLKILRQECARIGQPLAAVKHLDVMKLSKHVEGSLFERLAAVRPDIASGLTAHDPLSDAIATMALLNEMLGQGLNLVERIASKQIQLESILNTTTRPLPPKAVAFDGSFIVKELGARTGEDWLEPETLWIASMYRKGKSFEDMAFLIGRSPMAVAGRLYKGQHLSREEFLQLRSKYLAS